MEAERKIIQVEGVGPATSRKKRKKKWLVLIGLAGLSAAALGVMRFMTRSEIIVVSEYTTATVEKISLGVTAEASGTVVFPRQMWVVSPREGYTETLLTEEGQSIGVRDVLAVLSVPDLEDSFDDLTADLAAARITLEELEVESRYQIANLETDLTRKAEALEEAREESETAEDLASLRSSRESDYEAALDQLQDAQEAWEDAAVELERQKTLREIDLKKQNAAIEQIQTSLERVREDIAEARIKSPIGGEILSVNETLSVPGSLVLKNEELFLVADTREVYIDLEVYEQYSGALSPGDPLDLTVGTAAFTGEIVNIGRVASLSSDGLAATVSVRTKPAEPVELTSGASAVAIFSLETKEDALVLPRGAYLTTGNQEYLYRVEGGKAVRTAVTYGTIQGTHVEILAGVNEGDEIIVSGYQNYIDQQMVTLK